MKSFTKTIHATKLGIRKYSSLLTPELLIDKSRIQEIYDLRVRAYENSPKSNYVNAKLFPTGWKDDFDESEDTFHFIVQDNNKIVASGRVAMIHPIEKSTWFVNVFEKYALLKEKPFAYFSRLVVDKEYRKMGIPDSMDRVRINFLRKNNVAKYAIGWATPDRHPSLLKYGFVNLGLCNFNFGNTENRIGGPSQPQSFFCNYLH
jgi:predicted GNAT family N-acyltransferase